MTVARQISSLVVSFFTSTWMRKQITLPLLILIKIFRNQRKERRSVTNNTIKLTTQTIYTINLGELQMTKAWCNWKMTKFLVHTSKNKIHTKKSRQRTICKICLASHKTKQEKSFIVVTLRSQNKSWRRRGENNRIRTDILKSITNSQMLKMWLSKSGNQLLTTWLITLKLTLMRWHKEWLN